MSYRSGLPQLGDELFLTDGGIETTLIFHQGLDLPAFAAFVLLRDEAGTDELRRYYAPYLELAREHGTGFVLESPTWRASPRWAAELGVSEEELDALNRSAIALMEELRDERRSPRRDQRLHRTPGRRLRPGHDVVGGRGARLPLDPDRDVRRHRRRHGHGAHDDLRRRGDGPRAGRGGRGPPVAISFTLETDGRLPSGQDLGYAIEEVDDATGGGPAYYMINCAHPTHFEAVLEPGAAWGERIRGLRANASAKSHAELDEAEELDEGDPADLGERHAALRERLPKLTVLGGCCGTDHRHVGEIARRCAR